LKSEKRKRKKKNRSKWKAKQVWGGGGGGGLNFLKYTLKKILDEIKIRWKKVENLRIMINDTKARNGKN
jgi:hypothetical protein